MRRRPAPLFLSLTLSALCFGSWPTTRAGDAVSTVDDVRLGKRVCGPAVTTGDLKGRVVLLEFWGVR
jgi:hypothetical protein